MAENNNDDKFIEHGVNLIENERKSIKNAKSLIQNKQNAIGKESKSMKNTRILKMQAL